MQQPGHGPEFFAGKIAADRSAICLGRQRRVSGGGAGHQHFMGAVPRQNGGTNADDGVGFTFPGLVDDPVKGFVARGIEDVAVFFYFAAAERSGCPREAAAEAHGIGDVAKSVLKRLIAGVDMTIEFLGVAGAGEKSAGR